MQIGLQLRAKQQQRLTPQLQEVIRLMPLSSMALRTEIELFAQTNPLLEIEEAAVENEAVDESYFRPLIYSAQHEKMSGFTRQADDYGEEESRDSLHEETLHEKLSAQLNQCVLTPKEEILGLAIIDAINSEGYLQQSSAEIASMLHSQGVDVAQSEVEVMLNKIQSFEPSGVGARDLSECLVLQLMQQPVQVPCIEQAITIARHAIQLMLDRDYKKLRRVTGLSEQECDLSIRLIQSLNPRPGAQFSPVAQHYTVPDVIAAKVQNAWTIQLNGSLLPRFKINTEYLTLLTQAKGTATVDYKRERLKEVKNFIKGIEMRQQTLMMVAQKILENQIDFLERGPIALRPMTLQIMADELGLHESTVSRITTQKFMLTPHGLFEFKYFFSSQVRTENGEGISSTAIRTAIQQLINHEDRARPLSDNAIAAILQSQGVMIARRTVMKYREALGVLNSVDRRDSKV